MNGAAREGYPRYPPASGKRKLTGHIGGMKTRSSIALSAAFLAAAILLVFRDELHARGPRHLTAEPATECGFWGDMSAGMSCR